MTSPRWTHSFSLSEQDEKSLQDVLTKMKAKYPRFGIIDIVNAGINRFKYHDDFEKEIAKNRDAKLKK